MAKASDGPPGGGLPGASPGLSSLIADAAVRRGPPPVHLWDPPFCGDIDMRIARDGSWHYRGSPIGRPALVRLFASVLRRDRDRYVLVTPVEKLGIAVEDAPFVGVELAGSPGEGFRLRTNLDEWVEIDAAHPLRFEPGPAGSLKPYARVRGDLWALVGRPVFYELVDKGEVRPVDGVDRFGVASGASFFPMMDADALDGLGADPALG
ncbi:DUF1285 domain-containing protein [Lichenibacterium dinghuense]|uniref:DUF1285 domain-containing protein n=1 Tax=Lichenibacterium dinghuense TaxID=2895977 RepID=UPI001F1E2141|nr:DUF1285 domain-containing protein [Lichenibacterium sp. 6Y81]